jgi:H/ACA ribonucleoprotein complex subunit 1
MGLFIHPCEGEMVCSRSPSQPKIPYFNAPIYLENKTQIGKVEEILGPMNQVFFTVKLDSGVVADSFKKNDKVYIGADKLLPLERFLPAVKPAGGKRIYYFLCSVETYWKTRNGRQKQSWWTWWI